MEKIKIVNANVNIDECGIWIHADMNDQDDIPKVRGVPMKSTCIANTLYYDMGNKTNVFLRT